jgi:hypothetical protein
MIRSRRCSEAPSFVVVLSTVPVYFAYRVTSERAPAPIAVQ